MNAQEALETLRMTHKWLCNIQDDERGFAVLADTLPSRTGFTATNNAINTLQACVDACEAAAEWAAAFPLGIASTEADIDAAADVYSRCDRALKGEL